MNGTTVCGKHGAGKNSPVRKAADAKVEQQRLEKVARTFGTPVKVGVLEGLLQEWERTNGIVAWLEAEIAHLESDQLTWVDMKDTPQVHGLTVLYAEERKHLVNLGVQLARLGFEERQLRVGEQQGRMLAGVFLRILGAAQLGLSPDQVALARSLFRSEMQQVTA